MAVRGSNVGTGFAVALVLFLDAILAVPVAVIVAAESSTQEE